MARGQAVLLAGLLGALAVQAEAGRFDGTYRQTEGADCSAVGQEGGALRISGGVFNGVGLDCQMTNPVNVRGMDAVLYDMQCSGSDTSWSERAMLLRAADGGLIMIWDGYAFRYPACTP